MTRNRARRQDRWRAFERRQREQDDRTWRLKGFKPASVGEMLGELHREMLGELHRRSKR